MYDQAYQLRRLVSRITVAERGVTLSRQLVVTGSKSGVGTTTIATNLAVALSQLDQRVLLVDANPTRGGIASICRIQGRHDLDDVLSGKSTLLQSMLTGPDGIQVVPRFGVGRDSDSTDMTAGLASQLQSVAHVFDYVIIDGGCCPIRSSMLWPLAEQAIVVSTADYVAVTETYSLIKTTHRDRIQTKVAALVNRCSDQDEVLDVQRRLMDACQQFLQLELDPLGAVPDDSLLREAMACGRGSVMARPNAPSSRVFQQVAAGLVQSITHQLA